MTQWIARLRRGVLHPDDLRALGRRLAGYLLAPGPVRDLYNTSLGSAR